MRANKPETRLALFNKGMTKIHKIVLYSVWNSGVIPADWKMGLVVPSWKGKGDDKDCNSYRGVKVLLVPDKTCVRLLQNRIRLHLLDYQRPE